MTPLFLLAGFALGPGGAGLLDFAPKSGAVHTIAIVALVVILFRDGLEVEGELLRSSWHLPARKLGVAMPITCGLVAVTTRAITDLSWTESFLVGALLSPTDPVLSNSVVTDPRVPRIVRHSLNLESGLNDGLALAPVLALSMALGHEAGFVWWHFVAQDVGLGLLTGLALGLVASLPRVDPRLQPLYALAAAFATYGVATLPPHANGLIAVFVAAIVIGNRRADLREAFAERSTTVVGTVKYGVFFVFGSLLTLDGLFTDGAATVAIAVVALMVARPIAVAVALSGTRISRAEVAFMAWFGPRGVATMAFALLVSRAGLGNTGERIFEIAAFCAVASVVAHGLTDRPGVEWLARRRPSRA